jgi:hypothetical protein
MTVTDGRTTRYAIFATTCLLILSIPVWSSPITDSETAARWTAFVLQVSGFYLVWRDLQRLKSHLGLKGVRDWFRSFFPKAKHQIIYAEASGTITASASASAITGPSPNATIDERLAGLERGQTELFLAVGQVRAEIQKAVNDAVESNQVAVAKVETKLNGFIQEIRGAATTLFHFESMGLILFASGSLLSTIPQECAWLLDLFWMRLLSL